MGSGCHTARHPHSKLHVEVVPKLCEEQTASEDILHAAANAIAIAMDGAVKGSRGWEILANSQKGGDGGTLEPIE